MDEFMDDSSWMLGNGLVTDGSSFWMMVLIV
jgi:hypothetical protein